MPTFKQSFDTVSDSQQYRYGFPAYRVFIFGQEVTNDVTSVSINNSGSADRSAGTVNISLANKGSKYILTSLEAEGIGIVRSKLFKDLYSQGAPGGEGSFIPFIADMSSLDRTTMSAFEDTFLNFNIKIPSSRLEDVVNEINSVFSDAGWLRTYISSLAGTTRNMDYAECVAIATNILDFYYKKLNTRSFGENGFDDFDFELDKQVKQAVISKKINKIFDFGAADSYQSALVVNKGQKIASRYCAYYPFSLGDCIFSFNDPIRVFFRDPFDPTTWYFKFSGFLDTWTENVGTNKESIISITGTDCSKVLRYLCVQESGLRDLSIKEESVNKEIFDALGNVGMSMIKPNLTAELFSFLTIFEILQVLFFGHNGGDNGVNTVVNNKTIEYLSSFTSYTELEEFVSTYITSASLSSLLTSLYKTSSLSQKYISSGFTKDTFDKIYNDPTDKSALLGIIKQELEAKKNNVYDRLSGIKEISVPGYPYFKLKGREEGDNTFNVRYWAYGDSKDVGNYDKVFGARTFSDLSEWNDEIHHRVMFSDLKKLYFISESEVKQQSHLRNVENVREIEDVITIIGNDIEKYPIGGRVYYCTFAGMSDLISRAGGVLDRSFTGDFGTFSSFKNKLSYIYDVATSVEHCFYCTPKGDFIFEVNFYDRDAETFFGPKSDTPPSLTYEDIFQKEYDGNYKNIEDIDIALTSIENEKFFNSQTSLYDYEKEFTIKLQDTLSYSDTATDNGILTGYRASGSIMANFSLGKDISNMYWSLCPELLPLLGARVGEGSPPSYVVGDAGPDCLGVKRVCSFCSLMLNRNNAEVRNIGLSIAPKFGLMLNRPILWELKHCYGTIVNISDTISANSTCTTTIGLNYIRTWTGRYDDKGNPVIKHFGDRDMPFNFGVLFDQASRPKEPVNGDPNTTSSKDDLLDDSGEGTFTIEQPGSESRTYEL